MIIWKTEEESGILALSFQDTKIYRIDMATIENRNRIYHDCCLNRLVDAWIYYEYIMKADMPEK